MNIELIDDDGDVIEIIKTNHIEVSDDLGFNVDSLRSANDNLPDKTAEIRIQVPDSQS